jgi:putative ABC transport system ATP-binding protein
LNPIVQIQNIVKSYGRGDATVQVLDGLDFSVDPGEFLCLWGTSGSGKTTLLNLMGMLDKPDAGNIFIDGQRVDNQDDDTRSRSRNELIGFVFQSFNLIPVLSALENVMLTLQIRGVPRREARDRARAMLTLLGLEAQASKRPDCISGGQRQRVAIGRALVGQPLLVLADEPTANLDSATGQQIIEIMQQASEEQSVTFVFSTHDQRLLHYATRNVHLVDGRIVAVES